MKEVTLDDILHVINESENIHVSIEQVEENLTNLGMDSISFIKTVVGLEEVFECEIPDSKLFITEMDTVQKIFDVLQELYKDNA